MNVQVQAGQNYDYRVTLTSVSNPTTGSIAISSSPSGGEVYLNNVFKGLSPITLDSLTPGAYTVTLKLSGYQDWQAGAQVTAGQTTQLTATLTEVTRAIVNTTHWITPIRVGMQTEYRLTRWFSLEGRVAVSPISIVYKEDNHVLRPDLQQPSFTMWGVGASANADAGVKFMLTKNLALTGGYRVWWNRTYSGTWENHPVGSASDTAPLTEFQTIRHGATVGLTAAF